jgi:ABC-type dipeptide/oligopeptide/nickel transport system permease component
MLAYVTSRLVQLLPHGLLILSLIFVLFRLVPGDPAVIAAGLTATPEQISAMRHVLGLDRPLWTQYLSFLWHLLHADLGTSVTFGLPVVDVVGHRVPATAALAASSLLVAIGIGAPIGILGALRPRGRSGQAASATAVLLLAIPNFWLGLLLINLVAVRLRWLPVAGTGGVAFLAMPTMAIAARLVGVVSRTTRASLVEVLGEDYIRTAQAKGLARTPLLLRHALRPALIPIVTVVGLQAGYLLGGSLVIESLFDWQGLGQAMIHAVAMRDYFLVQGITVFYVFGFLLLNLIVDISYAMWDPRLRYA